MPDPNPIQRAARQLPGHWCKGGLSDDRGNHCGIGHLFQVLHLNEVFKPRTSPEQVRLIQYMNLAALDKFPERARSPEFASFNDHPDTVEADVVAVMELAGERWAIEHD